MIDALLSDPASLVSAALRALSLGFALLAAGTILVNNLWLDEDAMVASGSPRTAMSACLVAMVATVASWIDTVKRLYGDTTSAFDPVILESALSTPPGQSIALMLTGLAWMLFTTLGARTLPNLAFLGAVAVVMSIGLIGHTLDEPRWMLYTLLTAHLFLAAIWMGVLRPLSRLMRQPRNRGHAADLAGDFGAWAWVLLPALFAAGGFLGWQLMGQPTELLTHPYARLLQLKVVMVAVLLLLGTINRFVIVPRLHDDPKAGGRLRFVLALEGIVFALLVMTVSTMTLNYHPMHH